MVFQCFWGVWGLGIGAKLAMLGHFFAILALSWESWVQLGSKLGVYGNLSSKLGVLEAILVSSRVQNRNLEAQEGAESVKRSASRGMQGKLVPSWDQVGAKLEPSWNKMKPDASQIKNIKKPLIFICFSMFFGCLGAKFCPSWSQGGAKLG